MSADVKTGRSCPVVLLADIIAWGLQPNFAVLAGYVDFCEAARELIFDAVVSPNAASSGKTDGVYSLQLVWPFEVSERWRLISYTIVPVVQMVSSAMEGPTVGLGNTVFNLFLAPSKPKGFLWGVGPSLLLPTRTDPDLGTNRLGLGPTVVLFYARNEWSVGAVVQNIWSMGGSGINEVNELGIRYILNYNFRHGWYLYSNATITADRPASKNDRWTIPVGGGFGKVFQIGKQSMSFAPQAF